MKYSVLKKAGNAAICNNMDESEDQYIVNEIILSRRTKTTWFHWYAISKIVTLIEAKNKIAVASMFLFDTSYRLLLFLSMDN